MIFKKINKVAISLKEYYRIEMPDFKEVIARKQEKINCELAELQKVTGKMEKNHQRNEDKIRKFIREIIHCRKDTEGCKGQIQEMQTRLNEIQN